jgi:cell division protein FtsB
VNVPLSRRRVALLVAVTLVVLSAALLGSFPARAIVAQRADTARAESQLDDINAEIARLESRAQRLNDPEEVQRLAREQYGYVPPGTESYRVITPSAGDVPVPNGWPFLLTSGG